MSATTDGTKPQDDPERARERRGIELEARRGARALAIVDIGIIDGNRRGRRLARVMNSIFRNLHSHRTWLMAWYRNVPYMY